MIINDYKTLTPEEEQQLFIKLRQTNSQVTRARIINSNLKLVVAIAKKYANSQDELEDLVSNGNLGLIYAVDKFDPTQGIKFSSYAYRIIDGYIKNILSKFRSIIPVPHDAALKCININKIKNDLIAQHLDFSPESIAAASDGKYNVKEVENAINLINRSFISLDQPISGTEEDGVFGDFIADTKAENPEDFAYESERYTVLDGYFKSLLLITDKKATESAITKSKTDYQIAVWYFLGDRNQNNQKLSFEQIGKRLGKTREGIRLAYQNRILPKLQSCEELKSYLLNLHERGLA